MLRPLSAAALSAAGSDQSMMDLLSHELEDGAGLQINLNASYDGTSATVATQLEDWSEHWPFPAFGDGKKKPMRRALSATPVRARGRPKDQITLFYDALYAATSDNAEAKKKPEPTSDSDEEGATPPPLKSVHPLASDWNKAPEDAVDVAPSWLRRPYSASTRSPMLSRPHSATSTASRSPMQSSFSSLNSSYRASGPTIVTKDEITALVSIYDTSNPIGSELNMNHMDMSWLAKRDAKGRLCPPGIYLNLGNLTSALEGEKVRPKQVLINSPRSAILILRAGNSMEELLAPEDRRLPPMSSLHDLTWEQKRVVAKEKNRQKKLHRLIEEYNRLDDRVCSHEHVLEFCQTFDPKRPSTAMAIPFATDTRPTTPLDRMPTEISRRRMVALHDKVEQHSYRTERSRTIVQQKTQEARDKTLAKIVDKEAKAEANRRARAVERKNKTVVEEGKQDFWNQHHERSIRVQSFRRLVARERMERRLDEVSCINAELEESTGEFKNWLRKSRLEESQRKQHEQATFLRRAQRQFAATQK